MRYIEPNIFNKNDYNQQAENSIKGLPSNNMSLNAKKPFLENKTRKTSVPYLLELDDAMMQMYFLIIYRDRRQRAKTIFILI